MTDRQAIPIGEIVKLMERGQITIPAKYRKKLGLTPDTPLNIFEWRGFVVIVPVEFEPKVFGTEKESVDWIKDTPQEYLRKVRYNPLEELWAKMARGR